jgi:hypothetical protein
MIGSGYLMSYPITAHELLELFVDEVLASVTNHYSRHSKTRENGVLEEALDGVGVRLITWKGLYPLGHVVYCHQYVFVTLGGREWSHEVYTPNVKDFNFQDRLLGHLAPPRDISGPLALITSEYESMCILENRGPKETCL